MAKGTLAAVETLLKDYADTIKEIIVSQKGIVLGGWFTKRFVKQSQKRYNERGL